MTYLRATRPTRMLDQPPGGIRRSLEPHFRVRNAQPLEQWEELPGILDGRHHLCRVATETATLGETTEQCRPSLEPGTVHQPCRLCRGGELCRSDRHPD